MKHRSILARAGIVAVAAGLTAISLTACSTGGSSGSEAGDGTGTISIWAHQGVDSENAAIQAAVDAFNASQKDITAELRLIPADTYTTTVTNTPAADLPDILEVDGPTVASYVYNQKLAPLEQYVSADTVDNATAGSIAEGTYDGELYGLAMYDSALGIYGNKAMLDAAGVSYPTSVADAWTAEEFTSALQTLAAQSPSGTALDINEGSLGNEWSPYAFSPLLVSAGGGLLTDGKADGALNSAESVDALTTFASWKPYVDSNADGNAFLDGRVALAWGGHWNYPTFSEQYGEDLVALPLPDFGDGSKTDAGSWTWGIGSATKQGAAAGAFLDYLLNDTNVTALTDANGAPPATKSAFAADALYQSGGGLALFGEQISNACAATDVTADCIAVYRPVTPGYPTISSKFSSAVSAIWGGADVQSQLDDAAVSIDQAFADNDNYQD